MGDELKSTRERVTQLENEIAALKETVKNLALGAARVTEEIADEWGCETYPAGDYLGVSIEY